MVQTRARMLFEVQQHRLYTPHNKMTTTQHAAHILFTHINCFNTHSPAEDMVRQQHPGDGDGGHTLYSPICGAAAISREHFAAPATRDKFIPQHFPTKRQSPPSPSLPPSPPPPLPLKIQFVARLAYQAPHRHRRCRCHCY